MCRIDFIKFLTEVIAFATMCLVFGMLYVLLFVMANP
jgi:hypothetical protein